MAMPTSIPTTTKSMAILTGVNTITRIIATTNTTLNHIITATSTKNITAITSTSIPAPKRRFVSTHFEQLIIRNGGVPLTRHAPFFFQACPVLPLTPSTNIDNMDLMR